MMKPGQSFELAQKVCDQLGVEYHIVDVKEQFAKNVVHYYKDTLFSNSTPCPCVRCNRDVKFAALAKFADEVGADLIATGHYARVERESGGNESFFRWEI
jgi:tRNA-specific 2-thiouridylase